MGLKKETSGVYTSKLSKPVDLINKKYVDSLKASETLKADLSKLSVLASHGL